MKEQMKSFAHLTKSLVLFVLLFALGVGQMWGWSMMYLVGDHWNSWSDRHRMWESTEGKRYVYIYMEQGYMFRFDMNVDNADPANMKPVGLGEAANLDDNDTGVRVAKYDSGDPKHINYSGESGHTYSGIICVHSDQITTYDDDKKNADKNPFIWLTRPSVKIRHNWAGSSWSDQTMTDKQNGKYEYIGQYGGNFTYAGITDKEYSVDGSPLYKKFTDATLEGSPVTGNRCLFEFNSSGYIGVDSKDSHRGSLKIIKIDTVTYQANGATGGTAPAVTEATYNRASTLATNTGSLVKTNYYFNGWNTKADGTGKHFEAGGSIDTTTNVTLYAEWTPQWTIKGSDSFAEDDDDDEMGDWKVFNGLPFVSDNTHRGTISLAAHTAYYFKVYDRVNSTYYGCGTRNNDYTFVGQTDAIALESPGNNLLLLTTQAGEYTFEWNDDDKTLKISYPNAISHPSMDYVYMERYTTGWNSGTHCHIHYFYNKGGEGETMTTWGSDNPKMTAYTTFGSTDYYYFPILTDYPKFIAKKNLGGDNGGDETGEMYTSGHEGQIAYWKDVTDGWTWKGVSVHIGIDDRSATTPVNPTYMDVAFNSEVLTDLTSTPLKTHYDFGGFYTGWNSTTSTVSGTKVINESGEWVASIANYTDASKHWIKDGSSNTLYAKWTKHPYDITLAVTPNHEEASDPATGGVIQVGGVTKTSMNAYQDSASVDITAVPAAGYKFKEWRFSKVGESDYDVYVTDGETYHSTDATIRVYAKRNGTLTAVFEPRFELVGSKDAKDDPTGGMPGWTYDGTGAFTVLDISSPSINLTCTCSLEVSTKYKFIIHDRVEGKNYGDGKDGEFLIIDGNPHAHCENLNMNMKFNTTGAGKYIFKIDSIDENNRPYVKILWPRQVNFGWKYVNADEPNSKKEGGGGTVTAYVHEGGVKTAISNGAYMIQGATISFTAHPYNDYDFAGWWGGYSYDGEHFATEDSTHWVVTNQNANAFAKFTEKTNTLNSGSTWSTATWSKGHVPTLDEVAVIKSPVEVNVTDAKAKKVLLRQDGGNTGKIDIPAGKELVVRTTIKKTTDGSTYGATGYDDIIIGSTLAEGNGALVMGAHDGTNKATVYFATKAKTTGEGEDKHNVNQFIGTPFNDQGAILYNYYGTKIYRFMAAHDGNLGTENEWKRVQSNEGMNGFFGYNILTNQTTEPVLEMTGTLCRTTHTETISGYHKADWDSTENMFANSWVAPIYIPNFKDTCFVNIEKTIYIFNAGTVADQGSHSTADGTFTNTSPGQYIVIPINSSVWVGDPTVKVIPSMQAFSVFAKGENPKLKFDYRELVYNPSNGTATIVPTRAPRRTAENPDAPTVLRLAATGESGYAAKIVLLERTDFTDNFDDGWDGRFLAGDEAAPQLYAVTPDGNMAINSIPNLEGTLLGFKAGEADDLFTFSFDYDGEALYLYDTQLQTYTRVLTGNTYAFTTTDNTAHNRFILTRNAPSVTTGTEPVNNVSQVTNKMMIDNHLYIFRGGVLYDATGRKIK